MSDSEDRQPRTQRIFSNPSNNNNQQEEMATRDSISTTQPPVDDENQNDQQQQEEPQSPASPTNKKNEGGEPEQVEITMNDLAKNKLRGYPDNFIKTSKYTALTFIPLNLLHQFLKVSNFYFLLNMIIALIPGVSPVTPATAVVPLLFVVGVALIKDGYEDYLRHVADNSANSIPAHVVRQQADGTYAVVDVESRDVQVGDIMLIKNGEELRADVLLLSSTGVESSSFIETCNLDGETNLKNRKAVAETWKIKDVDSAVKANVEVITGAPSPALLHWTGVIHVDGKEVSVGLDQFLYRSCILKNTEEAWGVVLYAGVDTKMFRNLEEKPPKYSNLDVKLNWLIVAVFILQIVLLIILASCALAFNNTHESHWYMKKYIQRQTGAELWGYRFLTYFILMSYLIPISLFVTLELCKVAQAKLMEWDHEMYEWMHGKWQHCTANTSNLNEQLSQVKFIFSDKTGTLTENVMRYSLGDALGLPIDADSFDTSIGQMNDDRMRRYMLALGLCHTIQPFEDEDSPSGLKYDGASPDEIALVQTAVTHKVELRERYTRSMKLRVGDHAQELEYEILATLEFTPDRKMMSIVVRNPENGKIEIYTKGADSFVMPRLNQAANQQNLEHAVDRLRDMAKTGLRTLMVCYREISQQEFDAWHLRFIEAGKALVNRSQIVDQVCLELEKDLMMVGLTAIEDKLQDKVPETIQFFLAAKVVVWMLTGDKRETALTIAATSSLADPDNDYIDHIDIGSLDPSKDQEAAIKLVSEQLDVIDQHVHETEGKKCTFVIDGPALSIAMSHLQQKFVDISQLVNSAVCCRLTPLQKANVVNMFQQTTGLTALAIGDGANDVPMISEGKVGVGIVGLEGAQAALAADYAIPRFKHLRKLCVVHGRYALVRNAFAVFVSFYKNFVMALTGFWFAIFSGFSGQSLYDGWLLSFYNFAFTSMPPLIIGMFEQDCPSKGLMERPDLFPDLADGLYFNYTLLSGWFGEGFIHSVIVFFTMWPMLLGGDVGEHNVSGEMVGSIMMSCIVGIVLLKLSLHVSYWQWIIFASIAFSVCFYILFIICYSLIPNLFGYTKFYYSLFILMKDAKFWLYLFFFFVGLLVPIDLAVIFIQKQYFPTSLDKSYRRYQDKDAMGLLSASPTRDFRSVKSSGMFSK